MSTADSLVWALARQARPGDVLIVGVATPIATAAALLARALLVEDLTVIVAASVDPDPHDIAVPMLRADAVARLAVGTFGQTEVLDLLQRGGVTLQFVSPAQVDAAGRMNTSRVRRADGTSRRLPGGLATGDIAVLVGRLVAYRAEHSPRVLPPAVDFATGAGHDGGPGWRQRHGLPGAGVRSVVTGTAVLGWDDAAARFRLDALQPGATVEEAVAGCGFPLRVDGEVETLAPPPAEALRLLDEVIDPHGMRRLETRDGRAAALTALESLR